MDIDDLIADIQKTHLEVRESLKRRDDQLDELEIKAQRANLPSAADPQRYPKENRALNLTDQDKAFLAYIRSGQESKALVEDATGQYLVSPHITTEIDRAVAELVVMRSLCSQRTIDKDRLQVRGIGEASVGWGKLETGTAPTESALTPTAPVLKYVEDLYGLSKIGEDELMDNDVNLANILVGSFARAIAEAEEAAFVAGLGHDSQQPEGFTLDTTLVTDTVTTVAAGSITIEEALEMVYTCPSKFRKGAAFLCHSLTELALRKLRWKDAAGTYEGGFLWQPSVILGRPNTFLGYPIHTQDNMGTLAGAEQVIMAFGNFKAGYKILDHASNMSIQRLVELYAEAGLVGFKVHKRVGGYCIRPANKSIVLLTEAA